uniref:Uncharacterized protein n=1 Tax=Oryza barthii TaxID=65489 RepID=A0A0D3EPR4_9ORYZ
MAAAMAQRILRKVTPELPLTVRCCGNQPVGGRSYGEMRRGERDAATNDQSTRPARELHSSAAKCSRWARHLTPVDTRLGVRVGKTPGGPRSSDSARTRTRFASENSVAMTRACESPMRMKNRGVGDRHVVPLDR